MVTKYRKLCKIQAFKVCSFCILLYYARQSDITFVIWFLVRFSPLDGCERVNQSRMFRWASTHSAHSLLIHSFTSVKRRKSQQKRAQGLLSYTRFYREQINKLFDNGFTSDWIKFYEHFNFSLFERWQVFLAYLMFHSYERKTKFYSFCITEYCEGLGDWKCLKLSWTLLVAHSHSCVYGV